jgi:hypothetical protein
LVCGGRESRKGQVESLINGRVDRGEEFQTEVFSALFVPSTGEAILVVARGRIPSRRGRGESDFLPTAASHRRQ